MSRSHEKSIEFEVFKRNFSKSLRYNVRDHRRE
jgi:hypothetical protein